jgi:ABC-type transporter Mla MlaB component
MLAVGTERIGDLAVVECQGRIVRSEDAFKLRDTVTPLGHSRIIALDLSSVSAIEGGGLELLQFLRRWAYDREIQLKLFNPTRVERPQLSLFCLMNSMLQV